MEEGKSPQDLFAFSEGDSEQHEGLEQLSSMGRGAFARRLSSSITGGVELPTSGPSEDEAVAQVARRFRRPGLTSIKLDGPSLDSQPAPSGAVLESSVLDALSVEAPAEDQYVLEEVAETSMLEAEPRRRREAASEGVTCPHCHAPNPEGMRFCVQCGGSLQALKSAPPARITMQQRTPPPPSEASKQANPWEVFLISINEDGSDGVSIPLEFLETTVGREGDTRFPTDAFLSPQHARFHVEKGELLLEDLYSLNGTFLKLREEVKLTPGDTFLMGRQVLRFERFEQTISPKTKSSDGTRYMGSPAPGGQYKIIQIGIGGIVQNVYCLPDSGAILGREKGDIVFPHDKFMSSRHAQIYPGDDGHCYLIDLTSSNGTWIKLWERTKLRHNDYIFMGQQLFRVLIKG